MVVSQNGWSVVDKDGTQSYKIYGTDRALRLRKGPAGELLALLAAWFDKNVEVIDRDREMDDWGWAVRPIRNGVTPSNHGSGTAMDLNATQHPLGVRNTYTDPQEVKIRAELRKLGGVIRGGLDYANRADEMHFELNTTSLTRINAAIAILKDQLFGAPNDAPPAKPPVANDLVLDGDRVIAASSIRYAANGGYFHLGQAEAKDDTETFLAWWQRINNKRGDEAKAFTERSLRVWRAYVADRNWAAAGVQLTGIIKGFQKVYGLTPDGVFGPKSAAVMAQDGYTII